MATSSDVDPILIKAIGLLHSDDPNSATELRLMLDELIKQRYGASKMLVHLMTKRHIELEKSFPGVAKNPPEQTVAETTTTDDVINLTNSPVKTISDSPDTIADSDDGAMLTMATNEEVENLKEFGDLNCCVCGEMMFTATNRLIECSQCGSLYHQECHKPTITNEETSDGQEHTWQCNNCNDKPSTSKAAAAAAAAATSTPAAAIEEPISLIAKTKSSASSSRSSSSSNSSSPFYKQEHSSSSSGKHHKSSSSSSKSHKEERNISSSSTKPTITPSINIRSAPDKGSSSTSTKTKSSSLHSSSSKSKSSSSSSSKHHESSGSKRKLSK